MLGEKAGTIGDGGSDKVLQLSRDEKVLFIIHFPFGWGITLIESLNIMGTLRNTIGICLSSFD